MTSTSGGTGRRSRLKIRMGGVFTGLRSRSPRANRLVSKQKQASRSAPTSVLSAAVRRNWHQHDTAQALAGVLIDAVLVLGASTKPRWTGCLEFAGPATGLATWIALKKRLGITPPCRNPRCIRATRHGGAR